MIAKCLIAGKRLKQYEKKSGMQSSAFNANIVNTDYAQ